MFSVDKLYIDLWITNQLKVNDDIYKFQNVHNLSVLIKTQKEC